MCTTILRIPESPSDAISLLAVRDEDPNRAWNPLGESWPELPGVIGVQDRRAGGAWLAARPAAGRLAVILNREGEPDLPEGLIASRGALPLDEVAGQPLPDPLRTRGFNLLSIAGGSATVTSWDGAELAAETLGPGTHMLAHHDVDDPRTARIARWLEAFADAPVDAWLDVLAESARLDPGDDRAIVRDNRPHGIPTMSTLVCAATVTPDRADVRYAEFAEPGTYSPVEF